MSIHKTLNMRTIITALHTEYQLNTTTPKPLIFQASSKFTLHFNKGDVCHF